MQIPQNRQEFGTTEDLTEGQVAVVREQGGPWLRMRLEESTRPLHSLGDCGKESGSYLQSSNSHQQVLSKMHSDLNFV